MDSIKVNTAEMRGREIGLLFFLAELFTNYKLEAGGSFFGFGVAALEIMTNLIKDSPDRGIEEPSIKVVVQVLKVKKAQSPRVIFQHLQDVSLFYSIYFLNILDVRLGT